MFKLISLSGVSALAFSSLAFAQSASQATDDSVPLETIIVLGTITQDNSPELVIDPVLEGRLATLDDLFRGTPGVQLEPVFGGIDHPRFSIRGSGLQRGTQPAGRGIELRLDGIPISYADTSFDFVEWIDPLLFNSVSVFRGGRGALEGGSALGGIVDFNLREPQSEFEGLASAEIGSFDFERGQLALGGESERFEAYGNLTWFAQDGFREYGAQEALRGVASFEYDFSDALELGLSILYSDSELELPGPQNLAQIEAGSDASQPNNIRGDWRRFSERLRIAGDLDYDMNGRTLELGLAFMDTDVEFRRRDVQVEDNEDIALTARVRDEVSVSGAEIGLNLIYQRNDRRQQQFFNGGGTPPTFDGSQGDQWADNDLEATRLTTQATLSFDPAEAVRVDLAAGWDWHSRDIDDNFTARPDRSLAELNRDYDGFNGLALVSYDVSDTLTTFVGLSHIIEPPTYDVLLINRAGTPGPMNALLNGTDPRRPLIRDLDEQTAVTLESGLRGRAGPVNLDFTVFQSWLDGEIVSTTNAVTQNVTSVGNADDTLRFGVEVAANMKVADTLFRDDDSLRLGLDWTWTDAKFDDDPVFGDNALPIVVEHLIEGRLIYLGGPISAEAFITHAPDGGFADYANTVQADGYTTIGARLSYDFGPALIFMEGRNLTDERYVSSVIGARNNLNGQDNAIFAPGEPSAVTVGLQVNF
ncbi:MAG: TonB-dependent receptor [Pseudomonadota bacterium]